MHIEDPTQLDALSLSRAIHTRELSCREVMQAYMARIDRLNPVYNAIVSRASETSLLRQADTLDAELARGESRGWMHGMPQAIKDTAQAIGFPTTFGSPLLKDALAEQDSLYVQRMKAAGCIVIGKTNMPEFGLGSHTYNTLFGATGNAWDPGRSAGGSSGGAAVALAQRLLPVADGSDFMGSLRNPAAWNNIFGLRPSQGRVPAWPKPEMWVAQLGTDGPMARTVTDLAALLATQAGRDHRVPLSIDAPLAPNVPDARHLRGLRVGWLADLNGYLATEPGVLSACEDGLQRLSGAGAVVEPTDLGFTPESLWQAWLVWRRALVAPAVAALLNRPGARDHIKPEALWEHDCAQGLGFADFMQASAVRSAFYAHLLSLFEHFDVLALPAAQVWPFDINMDWPRQIANRTMDTYHRWMEVTTYATLAGLPAISVPTGFDKEGRMPMGLQLIGRPHADAALLDIAGGYELLIGDWLSRRPPQPEVATR